MEGRTQLGQRPSGPTRNAGDRQRAPLPGPHRLPVGPVSAQPAVARRAAALLQRPAAPAGAGESAAEGGPEPDGPSSTPRTCAWRPGRPHSRQGVMRQKSTWPQARPGRGRAGSGDRGGGDRRVRTGQHRRYRTAGQGRRRHRHRSRGPGRPGPRERCRRSRPDGGHRGGDRRAQPGPDRVRPDPQTVDRGARLRDLDAAPQAGARLRAPAAQFAVTGTRLDELGRAAENVRITRRKLLEPPDRQPPARPAPKFPNHSAYAQIMAVFATADAPLRAPAGDRAQQHQQHPPEAQQLAEHGILVTTERGLSTHPRP